MKRLYDIWFSNLDIENNEKLKILDKFNTKEIYNMDFENLVKLKVDDNNLMQILSCKNLDESKRILEYMIKNNIKLISVRDEQYPIKLHNIENKPAFLYIRGNEKILDDDAVRNCWMQNGKQFWKSNCSSDC